jgi:hypothetical protein
MVMQGNFFQIGIFIAENLKGFAVHGLAGIKPLGFGRHNYPHFQNNIDG